MVAIVAIAAIVGVVVLLYDNKSSGESSKASLKLEDLLNGQYQAAKFNGTWITDDKFHYFDAEVNFN